ncbi:MAG: hypothetical protein FJW39_30400 [Acidobacteria bacterium]|nr:hypothetical protein [Acidobacteriota bacterium]
MWLDELEQVTREIEASGPDDWNRIAALTERRGRLCTEAPPLGPDEIDRLRKLWERGQVVSQRLQENAARLRAQWSECARCAALLRSLPVEEPVQAQQVDCLG